MENLKFTIEDNEIAELLGRQSFSTKESAVFELLKNSYDAGAKTCDIYIEDNSIKIIDSGHGMSEEDIKMYWMHVGRSGKGYQDEESKRVLTGSKGVGRFALARLGNNVKVLTKKKSNLALNWETDWISSKLNKDSVSFVSGTHIEILNLRDQWRKKDVNTLSDFLSRTYKSNEMKVVVHFQSESVQISSVFSEVEIGVNYVSKINLNYDRRTNNLSVEIVSDEFKKEIKEILGSNYNSSHSLNFNMMDEFKKEGEDTLQYLSQLGDFKAEFYFVLEKQNRESAERFLYKHNGLLGINTGIILYRNNFSISSFDGRKDWLDISARVRKSPAAASHPTGSWRVRMNQIFGFVEIDKKENNELKDLSNRQGLEEDEYYDIFKEIVKFGISRFEKNRQFVIRKIYEANNPKDTITAENKKKLNEFLSKPINITKMSQQEIDSVATEIKDMQKEATQQSKTYKENEQKHKYDVRILNVLATQGLRASAIAHELHNKRNALSTGYTDVISALKEYGYWEELNSEEYTRFSYRNVPKTLADLQEINIKLIVFLNVILNKIEKNKFKSKINSIETVVDRILKTWENQYNWVKFEMSMINSIKKEYNFSDDVIEVILDNLILNSIQHNQLREELKIKIVMEFNEDLINLKYSDNGIGLDKKYARDPNRILEVHETSRDDGHGLGMWIINNTLNMYEGEVLEIKDDNGFNIEFSLRG